ncbi:hypothetical protein B0T16DRAFT_421254 [Cercophora newfieldiana]|uniref:Uncharacterized protein n=1 Tax=Cercophora newfieldiana TaxID=92897 RepID=A0AA39XQR6_9PEZI|nr:hypothetical protein B0T16DRAFT_421254 [Cercophora newfieldiana]
MPHARLLLMALAAPLVAAAGMPRIVGLSNFDQDIATNITDAAWYSAFTSPNATGSHTFSGRDTRQPFPGSSSAQWTYTLQIRDDVPRVDGDFATGAWIQMEVPPSLTRENRTTVGEEFGPGIEPMTIIDRGVPQDESWEICQQVFLGPGLEFSQGAEAGCGTAEMQTCLGDLKSYLETNFGNRNVIGLGSSSNCPLPSPRRVPESCKSHLNVNGSLAYGMGFDGLLGYNPESNPVDPISTLPNGTFPLIIFGSDFDKHPAGNRTSFDAALRRAFVVAHVWGYKRGIENSTAPVAEVFCLNAKEGAPTQGNGGGSGGGSGNSESGGEGGGNQNTAAGKAIHSALIVLVSAIAVTLLAMV